MTGTLVIFAKAPRLGAVKTRLAAGIGATAALAFYRDTLFTVVARVSAGPWRTILAVTPDDALDDDALWPVGLLRASQGDGDLGARMMRFLHRAAPAAPVAIIGSDIPDIARSHIDAAFSALASHDLALGPSDDGGYWLIGASHPPPPTLFDGVRWSSEHALADTLKNASELTVATLVTLSDIDDAAAFTRWRERQP